MRKIAGPGSVSGEFKDYDPVTNPTGTYIMADWANDVQRELIGIQDELSIAEADGSNKYILSAIKGVAIQHSKQIGELFFLHKHKAPAAFDKDNPDDFFPAVCLDIGDQDLDVANWPDLVPELRAIRAEYNEGKTGAKNEFDVTDWAIASNVATLTFANTTAELAILAALAEDNLVHGSYTGWRTITLPTAIGDIAAGDYAITAIDSLARTVSFAFTAADNSGAVNSVASFYTHRIEGSTTTARIFEASARTLVSANDADGAHIAGLRMRDTFQGHRFKIQATTNNTVGPNATDYTNRVNVSGNTVNIGAPGLSIGSDGVNGTPRTSNETRPKSLGGHMYMWGRNYVA